MLTDVFPLKRLLSPPRPKEAHTRMRAMAQEGSEASVASSSSPTPNWWEIHANPMAPWNTMSNRWHPKNHNSTNSSCEEDISISNTSFTNTSNHSGLSMDSSAADLSAEPVENHLWNQVLLSVGSAGDMHNSRDDGENFLEVLSSKSLTTEMFDPAYDYLKKMDSSWDFANQPSINSIQKQLISFNGNLIDQQRLTNLSDLVNNWSIAPPNPQLDHQIAPSTCNMPVNPSMAQYSTSNISYIKHEFPSSPSYPSNAAAGNQNSGYLPYLQDIKGENQHQEMGASVASFLSPLNGSGAIGYQIGLNNSFTGLNNKLCNGMTDSPWSSTRNLSDLISFRSCLNKTPVEFQTSKTSLRGPDPSDSKKQGHETSSSTRGSGRGTGTTSEGKKKRAEDNSETLFKKTKHDNPTASPAKLQAPKVKLGDRITALQQIVSPFGKTDTASVLLEAINYIRFLQEQVQLLSDPYMKSSANKDHNSWGGLERKEKTEPKLDLRSRGLCLVPTSSTPQVYQDNNGPDYWTPTFRGCLYR